MSDHAVHEILTWLGDHGWRLWCVFWSISAIHGVCRNTRKRYERDRF